MKKTIRLISLFVATLTILTTAACASGGTETTTAASEQITTAPSSSSETKYPETPTTDQSEAREKGYVIVTDYVRSDTGEDLSDALQKIIDDNPRKTIFFPDGEYVIAKPILTSGSHELVVSLELSNFAIIKAMKAKWRSDNSMIRLGGKNPELKINSTGNNNYISGGIIDGSGIAKGLSVEGAREYSIRNISIKNVTQGIFFKYNKEHTSNDADVFNVNIYGSGANNSIGVLIEGYDNTLTNMRIANFQIGVKIKSAGNFLRNIHPLYIYGDKIKYENSIGFDDQGGANWYDICYPDNFAVGFRMHSGTSSSYSNCYCYWYSSNGGIEVGFQSTGKMNAVITNCRVDVREDTENAFLKVAEKGGGGLVENPRFDVDRCEGANDYLDYLSGEVIWSK